ncbi:MAG: hypothetical protein J7M05_06640, partial [Anaerolineae bacterium]|nr:hypothetical protein [Anaerolineae bacterium]
SLVSYRLVADGKLLGPKLGARFPKVRAALSQLDPAEVVRRVRAGLPIVVEVDGEEIELSPEEITVHADPLAGLAVASEKGVTVAVDTVLTPELKAEGLVRDLVRYVQTLRKEADYQLDQRISVGLFGLTEEVQQAIEAFRDYFCQETLCVNLLTEDDGASWDRRRSFKLAGSQVEVAVRR